MRCTVSSWQRNRALSALLEAALSTAQSKESHAEALKATRARYELVVSRLESDAETELEKIRADFMLAQAELTRKDVEIHSLREELQALKAGGLQDDRVFTDPAADAPSTRGQNQD